MRLMRRNGRGQAGVFQVATVAKFLLLLFACVCCRFVGVALGYKSIVANNCHINNPSLLATPRAYAFLGSLCSTNPFAQGVCVCA